MRPLSEIIVTTRVPAAHDMARAAQAWDDFRSRLGAQAAWGDRAPARALLNAVFGNSPYLTRLCLRRAEDVACLLNRPPEESRVALIEETTRIGREAESEGALMRAVRVQKQRVALLTALAYL